MAVVRVKACQKLVAANETTVLTRTDQPADQPFQPVPVQARQFIGMAGGTTSPVFRSSIFRGIHRFTIQAQFALGFQVLMIRSASASWAGVIFFASSSQICWALPVILASG